MSLKSTTLGDALEDAIVFVDGDWVESKDQDPNGDIRLIQLADIGDGDFINKSLRFLTSAKAKELKCTLLEEGDILIARMPDPLGRACIFPGLNQKCVTVVDVCIVRVNPKKIYNRYLMHALNSNDVRRKIERLATGTTRQRISRGNLKTVDIPLPPLEEQKRIADILDKAEALRAKRREAITLINSLTQSIFLEMFGDPEINPMGWEFVTPERIANEEKYSIAIGPFGSSLLASDYRDNGVPLVFVRNIRENSFFGPKTRYVTIEKAEELKAHFVRGGDVLMTKMGEPPGDSAIYPDNQPDAVITADCIKLTVNREIADPRFIQAVFDSKFVRSQVERAARGVAQQKINLTLFKSLNFPLPPLALQKEFCLRLNCVHVMAYRNSSQHKLLDSLFSSIQHQAFTGNL